MKYSVRVNKYHESRQIYEVLEEDNPAVYLLFGLCNYIASNDTLKQGKEIFDDLKRGKLHEIPNYNVKEVTNVDNYNRTGKMKYDMTEMAKDNETIGNLLHKLFKDVWDKTTKDLNGVIDDNTLALIKLILNIDSAMQEADPEIFENNFTNLMKHYDWTEVETEYLKNKKMHTITTEWLKEKQERELQKVLEMDVMHYADEPSTQLIESSDYQYHRRFLSHKFKDSPDYQEAYTKFMEFATRQEGLIIPKLGEYGKYIAINIHKFRLEQKRALFAIIRKLELIHADMKKIQPDRAEVKVTPAGSADCFRFANDFVRATACDIVKQFYLGSAANLALIETAFYDHNLLLKRNSHRAFVKTLIAWGALPDISDDATAKLANGMAYKMKALPSSGYEEWDRNNYGNDKKTCADIGKKLGTTMPYSRKSVQ